MLRYASSTEPWYDKSLFSQPTGVGYEGFGDTGRTFFRRPNVPQLRRPPGSGRAGQRLLVLHDRSGRTYQLRIASRQPGRLW